MKSCLRFATLAIFLLFATCTMSLAAKGVGEFNKIGAVINYLGDVYAAPFVKFLDMRISPIIRCENWIEVPWEVGINTPESRIVPDLQKVAQFSNSGDVLSCQAINVSVSAETYKETKQPVLSVTIMGKLYSGTLPAQELLKKQNDRISEIFRALLKETTFKPQVQRRVAKPQTSNGEVPAEEVRETMSGKHWLTNLRVDSDARTQVAGYGLELKAITKLAENLENSGQVVDVFINSLTKNVYEKTPVWRFEMNFKAR